MNIVIIIITLLLFYFIFVCVCVAASHMGPTQLPHAWLLRVFWSRTEHAVSVYRAKTTLVHAGCEQGTVSMHVPNQDDPSHMPEGSGQGTPSVYMSRVCRYNRHG